MLLTLAQDTRSSAFALALLRVLINIDKPTIGC